MKKFILAAAAVVLLGAFSLTGCKKTETLRFVAPQGAPLLTIADMAGDASAQSTGNGTAELPVGGEKVKLEPLTADNLRAQIVGKRADIALAPINLCAIGYNSGEYVLAGVALWGINYIMARGVEGEITPESLKGETLYAFQRTGTPGITLMSMLDLCGISYTENATASAEQVRLVFYNQPGDVQSVLAAGQTVSGDPVKYALLAEPLATAATRGENNPVRYGINIQEVWQQQTETSTTYPQVGLIVRKSLAQSKPEFVSAFLTRFKDSEDKAVSSPADTAALIGDLGWSGLPPAPVIQAFLSGASGQAAFIFTHAQAAKAGVTKYLEEILRLDSSGEGNLIGGSVPGDAFFI